MRCARFTYLFKRLLGETPGQTLPDHPQTSSEPHPARYCESTGATDIIIPLFHCNVAPIIPLQYHLRFAMMPFESLVVSAALLWLNSTFPIYLQLFGKPRRLHGTF